ncbi:MAG: hypothetical protein WC483_05585 [Candidatus Paceibacterota bacterium]
MADDFDFQGSFDAVNEQLAVHTKMLKEIDTRLRVMADQISALATAPSSSTSQHQMAVTAAAPQSRASIENSMPSTARVPIRPYKAVAKTNSFTFNKANVLGFFVRLANYETKYPGACAAAIDLFLSCMRGFANGFAPFNFMDAKETGRSIVLDQMRAAYPSVKASLDQASTLNLEDPSSKTLVKSITTTLGSIITAACNSGAGTTLQDMQESIASLFQNFAAMRTRYLSTATKGASSYAALSQTYVGLGWAVRMPPTQRPLLGIVVDAARVDAPVPFIEIGEHGYRLSGSIAPPPAAAATAAAPAIGRQVGNAL